MISKIVVRVYQYEEISTIMDFFFDKVLLNDLHDIRCIYLYSLVV